MISEPDIGGCAREDVGFPRGVNCEIPHRLERGSKPDSGRCAREDVGSQGE